MTIFAAFSTHVSIRVSCGRDLAVHVASLSAWSGIEHNVSPREKTAIIRLPQTNIFTTSLPSKPCAHFATHKRQDGRPASRHRSSPERRCRGTSLCRARRRETHLLRTEKKRLRAQRGRSLHHGRLQRYRPGTRDIRQLARHQGTSAEDIRPIPHAESPRA